MLKQSFQKTSGITFIELLVVLAINTILFAALLTVFISNLTHYRKTLNSNRLNEQLQSALLLMSTEIRRAGYWVNASDDIGTNQNNNPFMASGVDVSVSGSCILFAYDHNKTGTLPAISSSYDDDRYGFRLSGQTLQTRPPGASFDCAAAATAWEDVTDPNIIRITALTFTLTPVTITTGPGTQGIIFRSVDISITGALTSDATVTRTLTQHIRLRNDKFIP